MLSITDRETLQDIRDAAESMVQPDANPLWAAAYLDLATAADRLDAMWARCILTSTLDCEGGPTA